MASTQNNLDKAIEYLQQSGSITGEEISNICVLAADALRAVAAWELWDDYEALPEARESLRLDRNGAMEALRQRLAELLEQE